LVLLQTKIEQLRQRTEQRVDFNGDLRNRWDLLYSMLGAGERTIPRPPQNPESHLMRRCAALDGYNGIYDC
jgi:hypothetical protein